MEERQRLAGEIHDTLAQGLAGIVMSLTAAEGAVASDARAARRHIDHARRAARESLAEARRFMWGLQPPALDRAPLADALASLAARWSEESGVAAEMAVTGAPRPLRPDLDIALLRASQEALSNVRKHAYARHVTLTLSYMDGAVALDVCDDGRGIERSLACAERDGAGGFGLASLRERVARLGGTVTVESEPDEGTTVAIALPLTVSSESTSPRERP